MVSERGKLALSASSVFTALATMVVLLRLYTRFFIVRVFPVEEYLIALAMLCSIGLTICIGVQANYGMGQSMADVHPQDVPRFLKAFWASLIVYYLSLGLTKTSIILQYLRVFPVVRAKIACWTVLSIVVGYTIWTICGSIFACVPIQAFWTKQEGAKCLNQYIMWFTNAAVNICTDFIIIVLPMPVIKNLHLARRQKLALAGIFAIGGFVCLVSILRLHSLTVISDSPDPMRDNPPAATWSSVETNVGIMCSCLPCLRPLVVRYFPSIFASSQKTSGVPRRSRAIYVRQEEPGTVLAHVESRHKGVESRVDYEEEEVTWDDKRNIHVMTEVRIKVDKKGDEAEEGSTLNRNPSGSSDSLVKDPASMF